MYLTTITIILNVEFLEEVSKNPLAWLRYVYVVVQFFPLVQFFLNWYRIH